MLPAQDRIAGQLALILVQILAWESRLAVDREAQVRLQAVQVGNLERVVGGAEDQRQAIAGVEDVLEIAEAVILRRVIVNRIGAAVWRLDAQIVTQHVAGNEVVQIAGVAAVVEARLEGAMAAAVDRDRATRIEQPALGGHVDDAGGAQAILRRQCAGDQLQRGDQPRAERLPEHADTLGQDDAIQAVLQVVVIAAHVKLAEGVLGHIGRLHDHLVEQRVVRAGGCGDGGIIDGVGRGAGLGLDAGALLVELLRGDHYGRQHDVLGAGGGIVVGAAVGTAVGGMQQRREQQAVQRRGRRHTQIRKMHGSHPV